MDLQQGVAPGGTGGTSATIGVAVPSTVTPIGVKDKSGNLAYPLLDADGNLRVNVSAASTSTANPAASSTGSAVPASASYEGINVGGTLRGITGVNPTGSVYSPQIDVASWGATVMSTTTILGEVNARQIGTWNVNVSGSTNLTLGAGSAAIGTVQAQQLGTWQTNISGSTNVGITGTVTATGTVQAQQSGTWQVNVSGSTNVQVVGTGTFATQSTLQTGTAVIGSISGIGSSVNVSGSTNLILGVGTAEIGSISRIGSSVNVSGSTNLVLGAGTAAIGTVQAQQLGVWQTNISGSTNVGITGTVQAQQAGIWQTNISGSTNVGVNGTVQAQQNGNWQVFTSGSTNLSGTMQSQQLGTWQVNVSGSTNLVLGAGTAAIGKVVTEGSATGVGCSIDQRTELRNVAVAVKGSAGRVYGYHIFNPNTVDSFVKLYDVAQGSVTVGSTTSTALLWIPAGGALDTGAGLTIPLTFGTAITIAATTNITGGGNPTLGLVSNIYYI